MRSRVIAILQSSYTPRASCFLTGEDSTMEVAVEPHTLNFPMTSSRCSTDRTATLKMKESGPLT